ncbi:MAG: hypothetical protein OXE92_00035 [Bacteroidetes bacterium]|nr:hypothetical protein [Bacteroidota bacterium]MCY4204097.1 hypothetical protein [Bacteroidota bacterium]
MHFQQIDFSTVGGGLGRMMERFMSDGTLTGDANEDAFIAASPTAAILGLLFDQRVRAEVAFTGAKRLHDRIGHLDLAIIADMNEDELRVTFAEPPAVHRFSNKMADTTRKVARFIVDKYDGKPEGLWNDGAEVAVIERRIKELPGFGPGKAAKIKYVLHYFGFRDFSDK